MSYPSDHRIAVTLAHKDRETLQAKAAQSGLPISTLARMLLTKAVEAVRQEEGVVFAPLAAAQMANTATDAAQDGQNSGAQPTRPPRKRASQGAAHRSGKPSGKASSLLRIKAGKANRKRGAK